MPHTWLALWYPIACYIIIQKQTTNIFSYIFCTLDTLLYYISILYLLKLKCIIKKLSTKISIMQHFIVPCKIGFKNYFRIKLFQFFLMKNTLDEAFQIQFSFSLIIYYSRIIRHSKHHLKIGDVTHTKINKCWWNICKDKKIKSISFWLILTPVPDW